jgi:toxin-antitoxin system PIN domain toxin
VNVWLALTYHYHVHYHQAHKWLASIGLDSRVLFTRFTQTGLLRLLTNQSVLGAETATLGKAWSLYDRWLEDPRVGFCLEPDGIERVFREASAPHFPKPAQKVVGDCYLLAFARQSDAALVTFDKALFDLARKNRCEAVIPS